MTVESLATVFSPNLLRTADGDYGAFFTHMAAAHKATKILIAHVCLPRLPHTPLSMLTMRPRLSSTTRYLTSRASMMRTKTTIKTTKSLSSTSQFPRKTRRMRSSMTRGTSFHPSCLRSHQYSASIWAVLHRSRSTFRSFLLLHTHPYHVSLLCLVPSTLITTPSLSIRISYNVGPYHDTDTDARRQDVNLRGYNIPTSLPFLTLVPPSLMHCSPPPAHPCLALCSSSDPDITACHFSACRTRQSDVTMCVTLYLCLSIITSLSARTRPDPRWPPSRFPWLHDWQLLTFR